jgi:hypothetical protein
MRTESDLDAALLKWQNGFHFPHAAIKPRGEVEFDFCDPEEPGAIAAKISWVHDGPREGIQGLAAWEFGDPYRFWTWDKDTHPILGWDYLRQCGLGNGKCQIVETPAEWLEQVGGAVCIIDWQTDLRQIFHSVEVFSPNQGLLKKFSRAWRWKPQPAPIAQGDRSG